MDQSSPHLHEQSGGSPLERAARLFEARLQSAGEGVCISSLPLLADEIAADVAGDDGRLRDEIAVRLRRRAGLHV